VEEDEEMEEEYEEGVDIFDALGSLLATEDGDTIAMSLQKIATQLEMHNKIMVKLLASINKMTPA
jgi:hypothetical protein